MLRFESNGRYLGEIATKEIGHPLDIAFAPDDSLWILTGSGRVGKLRIP